MQDLFSHPLMGMVILLGVLILVHEAGHYWVGRFFGIGVETFSIGIGGPIFKWVRKGTEFRLAWLPLGGFVKFAGMTAGEPLLPGVQGIPFYQASRGARAAVLLAGPLANLLLAVFIYAALGMHGIKHPSPVVGMVVPHSPAELAGFQPGDRIVEIDGEGIATWGELQDALFLAPGKKLQVTLLRGGKTQVLSVTPDAIEGVDKLGRKVTRGQAGVGPGFVDAVVTVRAGSPAAQGKLPTGAAVTSIGCGTTPLQPVSHWVDMESALLACFLHKIDSLDVGYQIGTDKKLAHQVQLSVDSWRQLPETAAASVLTERLGLYDSQLTIGESQNPAVQLGDRLLAVEGHSISDLFALNTFLMENHKKNAVIQVERGGRTSSISLAMQEVEVQRPTGKEILYILPFSFLGSLLPAAPVLTQYKNPMLAIQFGWRETFNLSRTMVEALGGLLSGAVPVQSLGGPIMIAKIAGDSVKAGWETFVQVLAMVSINLGILNLFPIPILDGGRLVLLFAETVRRRPLSEGSVERFQQLGFMMVVLLTFLATYNDLGRFWASIVKQAWGGGTP